MVQSRRILCTLSVLLSAACVIEAFSTLPYTYKTTAPRTTTSINGKSSSALLSMKLSSNFNGKSSWRKFNRFSRNVFNTNNPRKNVKSAIDSTFSATMPQPSPSSPVDRIKNLLQIFTSKITNLSDVGKWRVAAATFITSIIVFSPFIDMQLVNLWTWLQTDTVSLLPRMFRHDHWEWGVAVWAFFFWIHGYWLVDRSIAKADAKGITHRWKKYRLQDQFEAEKFRRMQIRRLENEGKDTSDVNVDDLDAKPPVTKQHKWHLGFWIFELPLYCLPLYIWDIMIPRRAAKIATWGAPTAFKVCSDVTCALLLYDLGFFVCHYLMHKVPFLYKYVHAKHHTSTEVRASDIVRLSGIEEVVDVGISILALNFLKCHPVSRTIYNVIITFLLTELHCGYAFPWTPQFVVPFGLATGSKGHHYHHRNGRHYYQKFFCHVDKLFGFVQKKDSSLQGFSV